MTQNYKEKYPISSMWKTRNNSRAIILNYSFDIQDREIIQIYIVGDHEFSAVTPEGKRAANSDYDLIEPWVEPLTIEDEIIIVKSEILDKTEMMFSSEFERPNENWKIIARKPITITEGEGL